jgi:hypothetical protein
MGRAALSYNRWFAASDVIYMGLGGTSTFTGPGGLASVAVNVTDDQWLAEALGGYRINRHVKVFGGARYNNITSRFRFQEPLGTLRSGSFTWWDPFSKNVEIRG